MSNKNKEQKNNNNSMIAKLMLLTISIILVVNLVVFAQDIPRVPASSSSSTTTITIRPKVDPTKKIKAAEGAIVALKKPVEVEKPPLKVEKPEMVEVTGGTFLMGVLNSNSDDGPEHKTTVPNFEISKYPITNKQFRQFVQVAKYKTEAEEEPTAFERKNNISWRTFATPDRDNYPVIWISYNDAQSYCAWLTSVMKNPPIIEEVETIDGNDNKTTQKIEKYQPYRLPTEAEWEYAARGGLERVSFPWGESADKTKINYNFDSRPNTIEAAKKYIKPVGYQPANNFGVQDLVGNVAQWCYDWYNPNFYEFSPPPTSKSYGPEEGEQRVIRGGSWLEELPACQVSSRQAARENTRTSQVGFRIIRLISQSKTQQASLVVKPNDIPVIRAVNSQQSTSENFSSTQIHCCNRYIEDLKFLDFISPKTSFSTKRSFSKPFSLSKCYHTFEHTTLFTETINPKYFPEIDLLFRRKYSFNQHNS
jgi:formylglycine-generating enzyme required for sulfatase activity